MGTRSSTGLIIKGEYKASYNQLNGYPGGVGQEMVDVCKSIIDWDKFKKHAEKLQPITNGTPPTPEQIKMYESITDLGVSGQSTSDWYCLLRKAQGGELFRLIYEGNVKHILDSSDFIKDSLFCEYAYIINLDSMEFEVYKGFQKEPQPGNKFGELPDNLGYYPCKLIKTFPLNKIPDDWGEQSFPGKIN